MSSGGALGEGLLVSASCRVHLLVVRSVEVGVLLPAAGAERTVVRDGVVAGFVRQGCLLLKGEW